jgi:hypothetical protein
MSIIGALPINLADGTTADATQVMADFNFIVSAVNANAAALAGGNAFTGPQTIAGDTITTNTAAQTLTNKTLTSPTINNPTIVSPSLSNPLITGTVSGSATYNTITVNNPVLTGFFTSQIAASGAVVPQVATSAFLAGGLGWSLVNAGAALDQKYWDCSIGGSSMIFRVVNDALNSSTTWMSITRGGIGVTGISISASVVTLASTFNALVDGRMYGTAIHNNANPMTGTTNQYIGSGTYTPTGSNSSNCSVITPGVAQWIRTGNVVTVTGQVQITPSVAGTEVDCNLTEPITSTNTHIAGTATNVNAAPTSGIIVSGGSGLAQLRGGNPPAGITTWHYSYSYEVT